MASPGNLEDSLPMELPGLSSKVDFLPSRCQVGKCKEKRFHLSLSSCITTFEKGNMETTEKCMELKWLGNHSQILHITNQGSWARKNMGEECGFKGQRSRSKGPASWRERGDE